MTRAKLVGAFALLTTSMFACSERDRASEQTPPTPTSVGPQQQQKVETIQVDPAATQRFEMVKGRFGNILAPNGAPNGAGAEAPSTPAAPIDEKLLRVQAHQKGALVAPIVPMTTNGGAP